jgi:hypothetical protein
MSYETHGWAALDADHSDCLILNNPTVRTRYGWALTLSFGLHLLLIWLAVHILFPTQPTHSPAQSRTIHLSFGRANEQQTETDVHAIDQSPSTQVEIGNATRPAAQSHSRSEDKQANPRNAGIQSELMESPAKPSAAQIKATAERLAKSIATKDTTTLKQTRSAIAKRLEEVFRQQAEAPGVTELADGTIRVVTEFGHVYCIRPRDESRILGPEDVMPVSTTCH